MRKLVSIYDHTQRRSEPVRVVSRRPPYEHVILRTSITSELADTLASCGAIVNKVMRGAPSTINRTEIFSWLGEEGMAASVGGLRDELGRWNFRIIRSKIHYLYDVDPERPTDFKLYLTFCAQEGSAITKRLRKALQPALDARYREIVCRRTVSDLFVLAKKRAPQAHQIFAFSLLPEPGVLGASTGTIRAPVNSY